MLPFVMKRFFPILSAVFLAGALSGIAGAAEPPEGNSRDVLVYKDGDRVRGRLVNKTDQLVVFQSDRFGELRVPADNAVVILAEKAAEAAAPLAAAPVPPAAGTPQKAQEAAAEKAEAAAEKAEAERVFIWEKFSPAVLAARLRAFFGPWHGRLAVSTEVVSDTADRSHLSFEAQLRRKWKSDEVQLKGRYDYSEVNELTSTDMIKADALWRHEFSKKAFALYRPSVEWNRASFRGGLPNDYVLLQQEIGVGITLLSTPARKLRVGVSENLFDVWNTAPVDSHLSKTAESAFIETELRLPGGILMTERGVYYYSFTTRGDGWENRLEFTKKFTETLSTAVRHELRRGSPDGRAQDYTRLKVLFGLDF